MPAWVVSTGPAQPVVIMEDREINDNSTLSYVVGTTSTFGDNELIAAPGAGSRIVITSFILQSEADGNNTLLLKSGANNLMKVYTTTATNCLALTFNKTNRLYLNENEALNLNLSAALAAGYSIQYYIETI